MEEIRYSIELIVQLKAKELHQHTVSLLSFQNFLQCINAFVVLTKTSFTSAKPLPRGCDDALCANPLDYPAADIAMLLRSSDRKLTESFVVDAIDRKFDFRLDGDENEFHLCDSVEEIYFPKTAERKDGSWLFLVNENREQGVYINKCLKPNQPCKMAEVFPFQYRTECKQQYIYRQLVAVEEGVTKIDRFRIPTGCSCVLYQKTVN